MTLTAWGLLMLSVISSFFVAALMFIPGIKVSNTLIYMSLGMSGILGGYMLYFFPFTT